MHRKHLVAGAATALGSLPLLALADSAAPAKLEKEETAALPSNSPGPRAKLLQSHIVFRHGARTPVFWSKDIEGLDTSLFRGKCEAVNLPPGVAGSHAYPLLYKAAQLDVRDVDGMKLKRPKSTVDAFQLHAVYAECRAGQLTKLGVEQSAELGKALKTRYGELASDARKQNKLWIRTSNVARCVATLQFVLGEFFFEDDDAGTLDEEERVFVTITSPNHSEWLYPNNNCTLMAQLLFAAKKDWSKDPDPEAPAVVEKLLEKVTPKTAKALRLEGYNFVRIRDYIVAYEEHGLPIPWIGDDKELIQKVKDLGAAQIARYLYHENDSMAALSARAGVGNLLRIIFNNILHPDETTARVSIVSAHDTTLTPILIACRAWDGSWPDFCSWVAFELWSDDIIRLVYNGKVARTYTRAEFEAMREQLAPKNGESWEDLCKSAYPGLPPLEELRAGAGDHW